MKNRKKNDEPVELGPLVRIAGFVIMILSIVPALALASYTWRDIQWLNVETGYSPANLVGNVGAMGAFVGYNLLGLAVWLVPIWMLAGGFLMAIGKFRKPLRSIAYAVAFQIEMCSLLQLCSGSGIATTLYIWRGATGGAIGWFFMTICLKPSVGLATGTVLMLILAGATAICGIGWQNVRDFAVDVFNRLKEHRMRMVDEAKRLEIEQRKLAKELEAQQRREEKEAARAEREQAREAKRLEREEKQRQKEEEKLAREKAYEEQKERLRQERERLEAYELQRARQLAKANEESSSSDDEESDDGQTANSNTSGSDGQADETVTPPYELPTVDLLSPVASGRADYGNVEENQKILVDTLKEFRLNVEVTDVAKGPVVTTFELLPAPGIRPEQIAAMAKTIEMRLRATSIRIEAPIPGKGVVGVEIPNEKASSVTVREILEGPVWQEATRKMHLPMLLGKDSSGHDLVCDLASMPHMLVAGATGSGKSVCTNAILTGLLMSRTPEELRLILVDPKVVEFSGYNAIPHLVVPIITDAKKVSLALIWAIHEMEKRYRILSAAGVKNIESFNSRPQRAAVQLDMFDNGAETQQKKTPDLPEKLPYIVIVVDEFADLMSQVGREIEDGISRLAAKARAVGIHLILATQRPSVKVVTGTIKANIPGRVAFKVAQRIDSQTIIDRVGAETLIGHGDMLFLNPKASKLTRAQGAFIGDADAEAVCDYIRSQGGPRYMKEVQDQLDAGNGEDVTDSQHAPKRPGGSRLPSSSDSFDSDGGRGAPPEDNLYAAALDVVRRTHRASTSSLQRALRIGYTRAARLIDQMEEEGIVGPPRGSDPREILVDLDGEVPENTSSADINSEDDAGGSADDVTDDTI